jgi:hypothetical protein
VTWHLVQAVLRCSRAAVERVRHRQSTSSSTRSWADAASLCRSCAPLAAVDDAILPGRHGTGNCRGRARLTTAIATAWCVAD